MYFEIKNVVVNRTEYNNTETALEKLDILCNQYIQNTSESNNQCKVNYVSPLQIIDNLLVQTILFEIDS